MDSLPRNDAAWCTSGSRATDDLRADTLRSEGAARAAGGGEGGTRQYSIPLGLLPGGRRGHSPTTQGNGHKATAHAWQPSRACWLSLYHPQRKAALLGRRAAATPLSHSRLPE